MRKRNGQENKRRSRIGNKTVKINNEKKTCEKVRKKKIVLANEKGEKACCILKLYCIFDFSY